MVLQHWKGYIEVCANECNLQTQLPVPCSDFRTGVGVGSDLQC